MISCVWLQKEKQIDFFQQLRLHKRSLYGWATNQPKPLHAKREQLGLPPTHIHG